MQDRWWISTSAVVMGGDASETKSLLCKCFIVIFMRV